MKFIGRSLSVWTAGLVLAVLSVSCGPADQAGKIGKTQGFPDLEALVEEQIAALEADRPEVEKYLNLNGKEEKLVTRDVNWRDDLGFFLQSDISKPSLSDSYSVEKSGVSEVYRLKPGAALPVRTLKVVYSENTGEPMEVEVEYHIENTLFDTFKELRLSLNGEKGNNRLVSYEIRGAQQLRLGSKKSFEIRGAIK